MTYFGPLFLPFIPSVLPFPPFFLGLTCGKMVGSVQHHDGASRRGVQQGNRSERVESERNETAVLDDFAQLGAICVTFLLYLSSFRPRSLTVEFVLESLWTHFPSLWALPLTLNNVPFILT